MASLQDTIENLVKESDARLAMLEKKMTSHEPARTQEIRQVVEQTGQLETDNQALRLQGQQSAQQPQKAEAAVPHRLALPLVKVVDVPSSKRTWAHGKGWWYSGYSMALAGHHFILVGPSQIFR